MLLVRGPRSGTLWRPDVVVASEQVFPKAEAAEIVLADGGRVPAKVAGRAPTSSRSVDTPIEAIR
jgi:hypothetical protein